MTNNTQYMTQEKMNELEEELKKLKSEGIPQIAKRIDEAKQMGDLSENAEYHQAREDMAWAQSRTKEIEVILENAEIISPKNDDNSKVNFGSNITVKTKTGKREYTIVGAQESDPATGKISNESPLGQAFLGRKKGDKVVIKLPTGEQEYKILEIK